MRLRHQPALDGLRGLAVAAVLLFHHGYGWAGGGFLGVSAFFTLSGFLITAVLLTRDTDQPATARLRGFWTRRARRLLPAAWLAVVLTLVLAASGWIGGPSSGGDAVAAVLNVANWHLVAADVSYDSLFEAPSAFQQYWSLAIEEQFYLVVPLLLAATVRRRSWRVSVVVVALLALGSTAATWLIGAGDRAYYGTDTRAAELLVGVGAALVVFRGGFRASRGVRRLVAGAGVAGATVMLVMWSLAEVGSGWLYRGGLLLHALCALAVVGAACVRGPVRSVLGWWGLVALGRVSYGVYLYHWPIFLWLSPERTGLSGTSLLGLRVSVTLAAAALSYALVERPVREGVSLRWPRPVPATAAGFASLLLFAAVAPAGGGATTVEFAEARRLLEDVPTGVASAPVVLGAVDPGGEVDDRPLRVGIFGDSTALMTAAGLDQFSVQPASDIASVTGLAALGCTLARQGEVRYHLPFEAPDRDLCVRRDITWVERIDQTPIDVAVLQFGPWEVADHVLGEGDQLRGPGDVIYDTYLAKEMVDATRLFTERSIPVIWLTSPHIEVGITEHPPPDPPYAASEDARMDRYNALLRQQVTAMGLDGLPVTLVDLATWVENQPGAEEGGPMRPDGVHFTIPSATRVAETFLGPKIIGVARPLIDSA